MVGRPPFPSASLSIWFTSCCLGLSILSLLDGKSPPPNLGRSKEEVDWACGFLERVVRLTSRS